MDAYIYKAALLCELCGPEIKEELDDRGVKDTGDSGDYPQGPYADGGGEADSPQHCDKCAVFLCNSLTRDGYDYVREMINDHLNHDRGELDCLNEWRSFYSDDNIFAGDPLPEEWDDFVEQYAVTALWSTNDESTPSGGNPLDDNYGLDDIAPETRKEMIADCRNFRMEPDVAKDLDGMDPTQAAHDFWLTRNGHGAGFWDRDLGDKGERLSKECKRYGSVNLYVGDDGKVYA